MKKQYRFWIGILISIVCLYLVFRKVELGKVKEIVLHTNLLYLGLAILVSVFSWMIRSARWQLFLSTQGILPYWSLFQGICVGMMANNILPFRLGDVTQAYFLGKREHISKSLALSTVVLERLLDLIIVTSFIIILSFFFAVPAQLRNGMFLVIVGIALTIFILFLIFRKQILALSKKLFKSEKFQNKFHNLLLNFYEGLKIIKHKKTFIRIIFYSVILWLLYALVVFFSLYAVEIKLSYFAAIFVLLISAIGVAIPSSPGYVGTWEFFMLLALQVFLIEKNRALSFALVYHFTQYVPATLLGLIVLSKLGISVLNMEKEIGE